MQKAVVKVHVSDPLIDYLQALLDYSRHSPYYYMGLSPRAGLAILHSAQAWALMSGREYVIPEDIQAVLQGVVGHRITAAGEPQSSRDLVNHMLQEVPIP
jgi:MoxR-like ATPase